jgi:uncharacterized membrane protein
MQRAFFEERIAWLAAGAALAYFLDPARGARRRAELRNKATHTEKVVAKVVDVSARDLGHRLRGVGAELRNTLRGALARVRGQTPDDEVLAERVRARLGRVCSHPGAIGVIACVGEVELGGVVLRAERAKVVREVAAVHGVRGVIDHLEEHEGARRLTARHGRAARRVAATTGAGLIGLGLRERGALGAALGMAGLALLGYGLTNVRARRRLGLSRGAVELHKTLHVHAPVEEVFTRFTQFETFPRFMVHVRQVTPLAGDRWRWRAQGPFGLPVTWVAEVTRLVPNQLIAWKTVEGSAARHAGIIQFVPEDGGTRLELRVSYRPLVAVAHPKRLIDDDLMRFKSLLEHGKASGAHGSVTLEQLPQPIV